MDIIIENTLIARQSNSTNELLSLLADPFGSSLLADAFFYSLGIYLGLFVVIAFLFCILRPRHTVVYAPRAKYADSKHAPPPTNKSLFGWLPPLLQTKEDDLVEKIGMDAAIFMRLTRMLRDMFIVLSIVGCGILIPVYTIASGKVNQFGGKSKRDDSTFVAQNSQNVWLARITPSSMNLTPNSFWAVVVCAWLFNIIICFFLWWNYRKVLQLRRKYFDSPTYQRSLHARTLLLTDVPKDLRTDDGLIRIAESINNATIPPRASIARNVKDLPDLIEEHEEAVRALEAVLAKYLKNPDKLPEKRPVTKASKKDKTYSKGQKVDAIEYWTARIKELEIEIKQVRESLDKRNPLGYGFASYEQIPDAHTAAYLARKSGPQGTTVRLAPQPNDLVWKNLKMTKKDRGWQNFINTTWVILLTIVWIAPNVFIAVFLTNLSNLGKVWPAFQKTLNNQNQFWAIVQGVVSPAITTLVYILLPTIFRRLAVRAGNVTKTGRERHVLSMLYSFFVLNNLVVVSIFAAVFKYVSSVVAAAATNTNTWDVLKNSHPLTKLLTLVISTGPYWLVFQLRLNFSSAMDLAQLVNLAWRSVSRRYFAPTPREMIELSAPQPFDYASYYNYYLFYATVALSFAFLQPLILPVSVLHFCLDHWVKKYMLLYIFITKYESGGMFWRSCFNRVIFMTIMMNLITALVVAAWSGDPNGAPNWVMLGLVLALPFTMLAFKFYCKRAFDTPMHYYSIGNKDAEFTGGEQKHRKHDRVGVRFGHPALYKPLMTPMVSSKSQHLLKQLYSGRTSIDESRMVAGYGDVYMDAMDAGQPGKQSGTAPFEIVNENELDFEHYKDRPEFREQGGGDGALFGRAVDIVRPDTPGSIGEFKRAGTFNSFDSRDRSESRHGRNRSDDSDATKIGESGVEYPRGYHQTPTMMRDHSPAFSEVSLDPNNRLQHSDSREGLAQSAAAMGHTRVPSRPFAQGYGPVVRTPGSTPGATPGEETSYDYFRRGRQV